MSGSVWKDFASSTKGLSADVNNNFDWIEGHLVPQNGGSPTTSVFDLGSTTARWNNLYLSGNFDINSASVNKISTDGTFSDNSDNILPTQKAIKSYAEYFYAATSAAAGTEIGFDTVTASITLSTTANVFIRATVNVEAWGTWAPGPLQAYIFSHAYITRDTATTGFSGNQSTVYERLGPEWTSTAGTVRGAHRHTIYAIDSPGAGTHTYQLRLEADSGTSMSFSLQVRNM